MTAVVVREDDLGVYVAHGSWHVFRPIMNNENRHLEADGVRERVEESWKTSKKIKGPFTICIDGASEFMPGDRVKKHHVIQTSYGIMHHVDTDAREMWFLHRIDRIDYG